MVGRTFEQGMTPMIHRPRSCFVVLLWCDVFACLCVSATPARAADPLAGTFADEQRTITLAPAPAGYGGTITLADGKAYPFAATLTGKTLAGRFAVGDTPFTFT